MSFEVIVDDTRHATHDGHPIITLAHLEHLAQVSLKGCEDPLSQTEISGSTHDMHHLKQFLSQAIRQGYVRHARIQKVL